MIRVVRDTNVIVSALLQPLGQSAAVFLLVAGGVVQLCIGGDVYAEHEEVIRRPRLARDEEVIGATPQCISKWIGSSAFFSTGRTLFGTFLGTIRRLVHVFLGECYGVAWWHRNRLRVRTCVIDGHLFALRIWRIRDPISARDFIFPRSLI